MNCLRCGHDKKLDPLVQFVYSRPVITEFYVCGNRDKCRARQQAARPAKMAVDARECGWMGCVNPDCEPVCAGLPATMTTKYRDESWQ
jgi:hypothetical protein